MSELFDPKAAHEAIKAWTKDFRPDHVANRALLDALAGCVRPVPPQVIDRERLIFELWHAYDEVSIGLVDRIVALVVPDSRFDTIRALHRAVTRGGPDDLVCSQCWDYENSTSEEWPCATVRALDGEAG